MSFCRKNFIKKRIIEKVIIVFGIIEEKINESGKASIINHRN